MLPRTDAADERESSLSAVHFARVVISPSVRRELTWFALVVLLAVAITATAGAFLFKPTTFATSEGVAAAPPLVFRDATWDDLSPKEWDPTRKLRHADGSLISDADPRAQAMLDEWRPLWDNAPTVNALDGAAIRMAGYVVPLDEVDGALVEFLLVPYFGACIHSPPPPANQIVHVRMQHGISGFHAMDTVWVSGRMSTLREDSPMGVSGYAMVAFGLERFRPPAPAQ